MLALLQTVVHLYDDYDRVVRPMRPDPGAADQRPRVVGRPMAQLQASAPVLLHRALLRSVVMNLVARVGYTLFLRGPAWTWMLSCARIVWEMPAAAEMSFIPPYHLSLLARACVSSFFLILLWESSNTIFGAFIAQEPLHKGVPVTNESPDPNGTLLNGLTSTKEVVKVGLSGYDSFADAHLIPDVCFLGTCSHQPAIRNEKNVHIRRH
jgi:nucleoporin NDC1